MLVPILILLTHVCIGSISEKLYVPKTVWYLCKANLRDLRVVTGLVILVNSKWTQIIDWNLMDDPAKNNRAPLLYYIKLCALFQIHQWIQTGATVWKHSVWVKFDDFFVPCDLEIWWMTLKNNRTPLPCYFKLCASLCSNWLIQTWVTVQKRSIWVKKTIFLAVWPCNLMYDLKKQ